MKKRIKFEAILMPEKGHPLFMNSDSINTLFILKRW